MRNKPFLPRVGTPSRRAFVDSTAQHNFYRTDIGFHQTEPENCVIKFQAKKIRNLTDNRYRSKHRRVHNRVDTLLAAHLAQGIDRHTRPP